MSELTMHKIISPDKNYYFMYNKNELTLYTTKNRKIAKFKLNVDKSNGCHQISLFN